MNLPRLHFALFSRAARGLLLVLAAGIALHAAAQEDPPGRVAYLNFQQGSLSMSPAGDNSWYDTVPNRPLTQGDRLWADRNGRAELYVGATALRMDGQTQLSFDELNDQALRVTMPQGRLQLRVREDMRDQRIELGTGNLALVVRAPGDYRVLVDPATDSTQVMVAEGSATVYGENGQTQELGSRQQAVFTGHELAPGGAPQALSGDFERWLAARNQVEDQSQSARHVSRDLPGYQQLDQYGQWQNEAEYGAVWYPSQVPADWAPYSDGYWITVAPWGLTWIDRAPWGFAPSHYGRWKRFGPRWGWVPGQRHERPVYAPALVGFVGGAPGASFTAQGGRPAVGWFPLAPGDRWRPDYRASDRYVERANRVVIPTRDAPAYANRAQPNAVTAVPTERFAHGGPIGRSDLVRPPPPQQLNQAQVLNRPPGVQWPTAGMTGPDRRSSAVPPAAIQARQQPEWRPRFEQGQREPRDQQDVQRRATQEQQARSQQQAQQQQEQARRQAEQQQAQQQEQSRRQAEQQQRQAQQQQQEQARRQAEQQGQQSRRQMEQQAQQQQQQQQEQMRRQAEQQANTQRQAQQQEQMRRQAEQQQAQQQEQSRRQAEQQQRQAQQQQQQQQQQEQMRRQGEQQQAQQMQMQQQQAQRAAQMQAQQQQEQMRRQAEQQQAHAQRQAQQQQQQQQQHQQQEQMRRQGEQQQAAAQRQAEQAARQQQHQMQQQAEQQSRQQQRQAQSERQRGAPPSNDQQQQQRP